MRRLIQKEWKLAMHPVTPIMMLLAVMIFIPNYPYGIIYFYLGLSVFFTCMWGRENHDVTYSLMLPIGKRDVVRGRICFVMILEMLQLFLVMILMLIRQHFYVMQNSAGMDANISLIAEGFLIFGVFNWIFFYHYYKDVEKVGVSFLKACVGIFTVIMIEICSTYAVPFVRDVLDTKDPNFLYAKLISLLVCVGIYSLLTLRVIKASEENFEKQDCM